MREPPTVLLRCLRQDLAPHDDLSCVEQIITDLLFVSGTSPLLAAIKMDDFKA